MEEVPEIPEFKAGAAVEISRSLFDTADTHHAKFTAQPGLTEELVRMISRTKNEPDWMLQKRLKALRLFQDFEDLGLFLIASLQVLSFLLFLYILPDKHL